MIARIGATKQPRTADAVDNAGAPTTRQYAVHIDRVVVDILPVAEIFPMVPAIGRTDDAADLDRAVQQVRIVFAGGEHQHALDRIGARRGANLGEMHAHR